MLLSVDDTPFGRAFGEFMLLFTRAPLDPGRLRAAYADLASLAAAAHPERAWPVVFSRADGPPLVVTVEGLLAFAWERYARCPVADAGAVAAAVAPWAGARAGSVRAPRWAPAGATLALDVSHPGGAVGLVKANCPWQVTLPGAAPCAWNASAAALRRALAPLRGARIDRVALQTDGALAVAFATGAELLVGSADWRPDAALPDVHYELYANDCTFLRVGAQFRIRPYYDLPAGLT